MPYVIIENFAAGLDTRRHPMTAPPGSLRVCENGHITRGGEISKRRSFTPWVDVAGTKGLAALASQVYVFGSGPRPGGLDAAIGYQQLVDPSGGSALARVSSWDIFDGKLYVAAEFADGTVAHFYDGVVVADWFDGRARGNFKVLGGSTATGVQANGTFEITAAAAGSSVTGVRVGSVTDDNLLSAAVPFNTDVTTTASDVVTNINGNTVGVAGVGSITISAAGAGGIVTGIKVGTPSSPNLLTAQVPFNTSIALTAADVAANITANPASAYNAAAAGGVITLTARQHTAADNGKTIVGERTGAITFGAVVVIANGNAPAAYTAQSNGGIVQLIRKTNDAVDNGKAIVVSKTGTLTFANVGTITGGVAPSQVSSIKVDNVEIMNAPVAWQGGNESTAQAIADSINAMVSVPEYTATRSGTQVSIVTDIPGADANGRAVEIQSSGDMSILPANFSLTAGFDASDFVPGEFVKTINTKMYSPSGSVLHFSGVEEPTQWKTDVTGAGFINMVNQDGQSQELLAMERYYSGVAVFSRRNVQIWTLDVDPGQNVQKQVLRNTGLVAPPSVEQFGDADVFYLSDSGVRSLRARDSSTAAAVNDVGTPIDETIVAAIHAVGLDQAAKSVAVIEPVAGRYWLAIGDTVYVYTQFPGSKISAWSTYKPGFTIDSFVIVDDALVCRSGDQLYQIGGPDGDDIDAALLAVELALIDVQKPAHFKQWTAIDLVIEGNWKVYGGFEPLSLTARELLAEISAPTLSMQRIPVAGYGTHANIRLECSDAGPARLANFLIHYELADVG
jgi:hypothetical protein